MESIPNNKILEFKPDQMQSVRKQYNLDKPGDMDQAIDILEEWIKMQNHFVRKEFPRSYLERALIGSKGSIERTKNKLDKICTFRTVMPKFFGDNMTKNRFQDINCIFRSAILPKPTGEHNRTCFIKMTGSTFKSSVLLNVFRYTVLMFEYIMAYDYSDGFVIIIDFNEVNLIEMIKALNLTELRQSIIIVTEGFGMRLKGIHLMTQSKSIDTLVAIFRQILSAKLGKRIFVHKDMSTVYKYVPRDTLPVEYGGKEKSLNELSEKLMEEITSKDFMQYIEDIGDAKTDETCRQTNIFNEQYLGMPGSFRTLNVD